MTKYEENDEKSKFVNDTIYQLSRGYMCYIYSEKILNEVLEKANFKIDYTNINNEYYVVNARDKKKRALY